MFSFDVFRSFIAVHRTLLDACRTLIVWLTSLFIYYAIDEVAVVFLRYLFITLNSAIDLLQDL